MPKFNNDKSVTLVSIFLILLIYRESHLLYSYISILSGIQAHTYTQTAIKLVLEMATAVWQPTTAPLFMSQLMTMVGLLFIARANGKHDGK